MAVRNVEDLYPLTPLQEGILFHVLLDGDTRVYWNQFVCTIRGPLDTEAFRRSFEQVVARHPTLRTGFLTSRRDRLLQFVRREVPLRFRIEDWRSATPGQQGDKTEQEARLEEFLDEDRAAGVDLGKPPLMRFALFRTNEDAHRFVWSQHHLISDGWSWPIVLDEVLATYRATRNGSAPVLARPFPFKDYFRWRAAQDGAAATAYFRRALDGFEAATAPGFDWLVEKASPTPSTTRRRRRIEPETVEQLARNARACGVTPSTMAQVAWGFVLSVWSGTKDVLFGVTLTARSATLPGIERAVGPLINTLPLRMTLSPEESVRETLARVQRSSSDLQRYSWASLAEIQAALKITPGSPLFESILVFENFPFDREGWKSAGELSLSEIRGVEQNHYPLTATVLPGDPFELSIDHDPRRVTSARAATMLDHWTRVWMQMAASPDAPWRELAHLGPDEEDKWLARANATDRALPETTRVEQLIFDRAARDPERCAVRCDDVQWTYRELRVRSASIAADLRDRGVGRGARVGLHLDRSCDMIAAMIAVLETGAAYVPLDPEYPADRLRYIAADAALVVVLTDTEGSLPWLPLDLELQAVSIRAIPAGAPATRSDLHADAGVDSGSNAHAGDAAYVIYTSGSTGRPKGVEVPHRAVVNFLTSMGDAPGCGPDDVLVAVTSLGFDISALELLLPLVRGACSVVATSLETRDGKHLMDLMQRVDATILQATPSTWRLLLAAGWPGSPSLKALCGGEALTADLARELLPRVGSLFNMYGPTETTIWSTFDRVTTAETITIGRPIANTRVYVLDEFLRPVPPGVAGELWIGGLGLATGYLGRDDLTGEAFHSDLPGKPGAARMYRTGDLAAWREDGRLVCLGRRDQQVKLRGFRIELGEIEAVLAEHPHVEAAAVQLRDPSRRTAGGDPRLVAFFTRSRSAVRAPRSSELRTHIAGRLPAHMVPVTFLELDELPRTPNGKIDRRALPEIDDARSPLEDALVAPRTDTERTLVSMWQDVLGVQAIGVHDNFFELGGHSLLSMQLVDRVEAAFGIDVPLRTLFDVPTIAGLARFCRPEDRAPVEPGSNGDDSEPANRVDQRSHWKSLTSIQPLGNRVPIYLIAGAHADEEAFLRYISNLIPHLGIDQPVFGFRARGLDGSGSAHESVEEMARDYVAEMRSHRSTGPYVIVGECIGGVVAFEMSRQLREMGADFPVLILLDTWRPRTLTTEQRAAIRKQTRARRLRRWRGRLDGLPLHRQVLKLAGWTRATVSRSLFPTDEDRLQQRVRAAEMRYPQVIMGYRAKPYDGRVELIVNQEDQTREPGLGWEELVRGGFRVHPVPGNHVRRLTEFAGETAQTILSCVDDALLKLDSSVEVPRAE